MKQLFLASARRRISQAIGACVSIVCLSQFVGAQPLKEDREYPCAGYQSKRYFMDAQVWWQEPGDPRPAHLHLGSCLPVHQKVGPQPVPFQLKLQLHDARPDDVVRLLYIQVLDGQSGIGHDHKGLRRSAALSCKTVHCEFWESFTIDPRQLSEEGLVEIRVTARLRRANSNVFFTFLKSQLWIDDGVAEGGTGDKPNTRQSTEVPIAADGGVGWAGHDTDRDGEFIDGIDVLHPYRAPLFYFAQPLKFAADGQSFPLDPVKGLWKPKVRFRADTEFSETGIVPYAFATIDPDFHAIPPNRGLVILDRRRKNQLFESLEIDTSKLTPGPHRLFLKTSDEDFEQGFTAAGVTALVFTVAP